LAEVNYEGLLILDSNRYGRDSANVANQIPEMIKKLGGNVLVSRLWEERRLAYPIRGQRKGTYWLTYFRLDPLKLTTLKRDLLLNDNVVRSLLLKVDPRIIDTLVAHALAPPESRIRRAPTPEAAAVPKIEGIEDVEIPDAVADV